MIGDIITTRIRMAMNEARYAGDLVNGSRLLDYFGDVGTELAIRLHGDEAMFLGYEDVRFLAPVHTGDFVEFSGWIEKVGNTSLTCKFEAYKYIELARDEACAVSAANVLSEPVLCATAVGTLLVKKPLQRPTFADPDFQV